MTVELDKIIDKLNEREIVIEVYKQDEDEYLMYIGGDNNSGEEYKVQSIRDIGDMVVYYIESNYLEKGE